MFAFTFSIALWKMRSAIGTQASGPPQLNPKELSPLDHPTTLHALEIRRSPLLDKAGTNLFDSPDGPTFVERSFLANKGRERAGQNPDVKV